MRKAGKAALVILAMSGLVSAGAGMAHADGFGSDDDPGGARAQGGSALAGTAIEQNVAQAHRQNNNCVHANGLLDEGFTLTEGQMSGHCLTKDDSFNKDYVSVSGGAKATGGSATTGELQQQNIAQQGKQNNNCANANNTDITLTDSKIKTDCAAIDESLNLHSADISHGAKVEGGSGMVNLYQQNVAQEGRQNNNCGNSNGLDLSLSSSRSTTKCIAIDRSKNIDSVYR
ncbi:hypothetical protein [Streptomyces antibioticus]|uniref:hypothetical protein n=1 Tax=Streptomyces antibioticus TaxID=1890 RepID=UPI0033FE760D